MFEVDVCPGKVFLIIFIEHWSRDRLTERRVQNSKSLRF